MSTITGIKNRHAASGRRGQGGFTLIEILITTAIAGIVLAPVGGWMILSLNAQDDTATRFTDAAQTRLLETYFARDVASAEIVQDAAAVSPASLQGCGPADDGNAVLNMYFLGTEPEFVVYTTSGQDLVRIVCELDASRAEIGSTTIARGLSATTLPAVEATCSGTDCKTVDLVATLDSGTELTTSATRRGTAASLVGGTTFRPQAVIKVTDTVARTKSTPYRVTVSAADSWDLDPGTLAYEWQAIGALTGTASGESSEFSWSTPGDKTIILTVTDPENNVNTVTETVTLLNQPPVITSVSVSTSDGSVVGTAGVTEFTFAATGDDPDGNSALATWVIEGATYGPGPVDHVFNLAGTKAITLVVTDSDGDSTTQSISVTVGEGEEAQTVFDPLPNILADPPVFTTSDQDVFDITVSPTVPAIFQSWELHDSGGAVIATSIDEAATFQFAAGVTGNFEIHQITTTGSVITPFRINRPPIVGYSHTTLGAAPTSVDFTDLSTDDNAVASVLWDFGVYGTSTEPTPTVDFTESGTFPISLTVTDADGAVSTDGGDIVIP